MKQLIIHYLTSGFLAALSLFGLFVQLFAFLDTLSLKGQDYLKYRNLTLGVLLVVVNALFVFFFLFRRIAKKQEIDKISYVWAILGTYIPLFFVFNDFRQIPVVDLFIVITSLGAVFSVFSLGKSVDLGVANRGIVITGAYKYVRHPIYASYLLVNCLYFLISPLLVWRLMLFLFWIICIYKRIFYEEKFLVLSNTYKAYSEKVRFKLIPGLW